MRLFLKITGVVLLLICISAYVFWKYFAEDIVVEALQKEAETAVNDIWQEEIIYHPGTIVIDIARRKAVLSNYSIYVLANGDTMASIVLPSIEVKWKSTLGLIKQEKIHLRRLTVKEPKVHYSTAVTFKERDKVKPIDVHVDLLEIHDAAFDIDFAESSQNLSAHATVNTHNFFWTPQQPFHLVNDFLKKSKGVFTDIKSDLSDGFHRVLLDKLIVDGGKSGMQARGFVFEPKYDRATFAKKRGVETDHIVFTADSIDVLRTNFADNDSLMIELVAFYGSELLAHRDKNYQMPEDRFVPILVDNLLQWSVPLFVEQVTFKDGNIVYEELADGKEEAGKVVFSDFDGSVYNVTNLPDLIEDEEKLLVLEATTRLYGKGRLTVEVNYDLLSENGRFWAQGHLRAMDLQSANDILTPLSTLEVKTGRSEAVYFTFGGSRLRAHGDLIFRYDDLKLKWEEDSKMIKRFVKNTLTNWVVPTSNPNRKGQHRIGAIDFERDTQRSMFNYWWKSLETGFLSVMGVRDAKEIKKEE